jgi:hypothetical protein
MIDHQDLVRVVNHTDKVVHGRFSGTDYAFHPGKPLDVPIVAAAHIFDFGKKEKTQALARLGWARTSEEMEDGLAKLEKIKFEDPPELIEATEGKKPRRGVPAANRTGAAGPPVAAGGTEGGDFKSPPNGPKIGEAQGETDDEF